MGLMSSTQRRPQSLQEILAMLQAHQQAPQQPGPPQFSPDGRPIGGPSPEQQMGPGPAQITPEQYEMLMRTGQIPPNPNAHPPMPNPQLSPDDLERLRRGQGMQNRATAHPSPFMRPL
jgi:hypothetical protein